MRPAEFWDSTPRGVVEFIEAAVWRSGQAHDLAMRAAWNAAALFRIPREQALPQLDGMLINRPPPKPITPEQEWGMWEAWAHAVNAAQAAEQPKA